MFHAADHFILSTFSDITDALQATTHLAIGAHPDDLEVMAGHGILQGQEQGQHFFGVICTDGAGSVRPAATTDAEWVRRRAEEQKKSAQVGGFGGVLLLGHSSGEIKSGWNESLVKSLTEVIKASQPEILYTHNPFDKHLTHVAVMAHTLQALKRSQHRPQAFYGCEVWRGLDWLSDNEKQTLAIDDAQQIADLISLHKSQTEEGKDYAAATIGRMKANATFFEARAVDQVQHQVFAVDLLPLVSNSSLSLQDFAKQKLQAFAQEVQTGLQAFVED